MANLRANTMGLQAPQGPPHIGDVVHVLGFEFAEVIGIGCRGSRRGGAFRCADVYVRNKEQVHVRYADGSSYHVPPSALRLVAARSDIADITTGISRCSICEGVADITKAGLVLALSCKHAACLSCWTRWANAQFPCYRGNPSSFRCWGNGCLVEMSIPLWNALAECSPQHLREGGVCTVLRRRRLQMNPLFPPAAQVDCNQLGCHGVGYLGSDTVMCFLCEAQWAPYDAPGLSIRHSEDPYHSTGTKECPKCRVRIEKNGGCDHMTCPCGHEFWWTTLQPFRL